MATVATITFAIPKWRVRVASVIVALLSFAARLGFMPFQPDTVGKHIGAFVSAGLYVKKT